MWLPGIDVDIEEKLTISIHARALEPLQQEHFTSLRLAQGCLALDPCGLCWLQWQKSAQSHQCLLKIDRGLPYRDHKLNHHNWKIKVLFCHARPSKSPCQWQWPMLYQFAEFTRKNDIKYKLVSPNYQASNGQVESAVKIVKSGLRRMSVGTLETKLSWFLLSYRITPHITTAVTPAELLMKRKLQTNLNRLRPSTSTTVILSQDHQKFYRDWTAKMRMFHKGQEVLAQNFNISPRWLASMF